MEITESIATECKAYDWIKDLITSGQVSYVEQIKDITGYDIDLIYRICTQLYKEKHISYFLYIRKLEY